MRKAFLIVIFSVTASAGIILNSVVGGFSNNFSILFNGTSQYISTTNSALDLNYATTAASAGCWLNPTRVNAIISIMSNAQALPAFTGMTWNLGDFAGSGSMNLYLINSYPGNTIAVNSPINTVLPNQWGLYGWSYTGNGLASGVTFYSQGSTVLKTVDYDTLGGASTVSSAPFIIGYGTATNYLTYYGGYMNNCFFIAGTALSSGQWSSIYGTGNPSSLKSYNMTSWLPFQNNLNDLGVGGITWTGTGSPTYVSAVP